MELHGMFNELCFEGWQCFIYLGVASMLGGHWWFLGVLEGPCLSGNRICCHFPCFWHSGGITLRVYILYCWYTIRGTNSSVICTVMSTNQWFSNNCWKTHTYAIVILTMLLLIYEWLQLVTYNGWQASLTPVKLAGRNIVCSLHALVPCQSWSSRMELRM